MKRLLLLRHAKAVPADGRPGRHRPAARGARRARRAPDRRAAREHAAAARRLILASPATRTLQTAQLVAAAVGLPARRIALERAPLSRRAGRASSRSSRRRMRCDRDAARRRPQPGPHASSCTGCCRTSTSTTCRRAPSSALDYATPLRWARHRRRRSRPLLLRLSEELARARLRLADRAALPRAQQQPARALVGLARPSAAEYDACAARSSAATAAPLDRFRALDIARRGFRRRAAPRRNRGDRDVTLRPCAAACNLQRVADLHGVRRLHALAVEPHVTAADGFGRGAAALEEPRAPQPTVDPQAICRRRRAPPSCVSCVSQKQYA